MATDKARKRAELTLLKGDVLLTLRDIVEHQTGEMGMGYTRIESSRAGRRGGYAQMTFGTIDDVTDARSNESC